MRITREQAKENRERALAAAADLFREKGFDRVGVAELMRAAGMTHGGFYNHFDSKEAIEAECCAFVFAGAIERLEAIAALEEPEMRRAAFAAYRDRSLSPARRDAAAPACPVVAFAGEMPRRPLSARKAFADGLADFLEAFARAAAPIAGNLEGAAGRAEAIRAFAMTVGAMAMARAVAGERPDLSDEILRAAAAD